jgi:hypothetical protein
MYLDLVGPHFIMSLRQCLGNDWYEALEYHYLALFDMIVYGMKAGWSLQRADEQGRRQKEMRNKFYRSLRIV